MSSKMSHVVDLNIPTCTYWTSRRSGDGLYAVIAPDDSVAVDFIPSLDIADGIAFQMRLAQYEIDQKKYMQQIEQATYSGAR